MSVTTVITDEELAIPLGLWGARFASAYEKKLVIILLSGEKKLPLLQNSATTLRTNLLEEHIDFLVSLGIQIDDIEFQAVVSTSPEKDIADVVREHSSSLLICSREESRVYSYERERLHTALVDAPCSTLTLRISKADPYTCDRILVALSESKNSLAALELGKKCHQAFSGSSIVTMNVNTETTVDGPEVSNLMIEQLYKKSGITTEEVPTKIVTSKSFAAGISGELATEDYHLVILGSSSIGLLRRLLFGTIQEELLMKTDGPAIAVIRGPKPLLSRATAQLEDWLDLTIPQLPREERIRVIDNLRESAQWSFDFMALMCLSTAIATLGLIQNSAAVVIGAMLVAPLMTPLLGAGLSLVQGNLPLMNNAARSIGFGFVLALMMSIGIGALTSHLSLTSEMLARGGPNLLDMVVGFLAGIAAAYSTSRPNLSAALPGVAIAAALVPPIATIGLSLTLQEWENALGASMLFAANVVCIILGAGCSFFASGIRWQAVKKEQARWFRGVAIAIVLVSLGLGVRWHPPLTQAFQENIASIFSSEIPHIQIETLTLKKGTLVVRANSPSLISEDTTKKLLQRIHRENAQVTEIQVHTSLVSQAHSDSTSVSVR